MLMPGYLDLGTRMVSATLAGVAGALQAQVAEFVALNALSMLLAIVFLAPGGLTAWVAALAQRVAGKRS